MKNEEPEKLNRELEVTSMDRMVMNTQNLKKPEQDRKRSEEQGPENFKLTLNSWWYRISINVRGEKEYRIHEWQKHEQKRKRINRTEHRYVVVVQHMKKLGVCLEQKKKPVR